MAVVTKKTIDEDGHRFLIDLIKAHVAEKTQINVVSAIDENSTNQQVAGAKATFDLVTAKIAGIVTPKIKIVTTLPTTGDDFTFYFVPKDADTYRQWYYNDGQWFDFGDFEIDLSGYWAKDELGIMTNAEIQTMFDDVMGT